MQQGINFLKPATLQVRHKIAKPSIAVIAISATLVVVTLCSAGFLFFYNHAKLKNLEKLNQEFRTLTINEPNTVEKKNLNLELQSLTKFIENYNLNKMNLSKPIEEISRITPDTITLNDLEIETNNNAITLQATADQYLSVAQFEGNFEKSPLFRNSLVTTTIQTQEPRKAVNFEITITPSKDVYK